MVRLRNIKKSDEFIEADYIPEDTHEVGHLKIRLADNKVVEFKLTPSDGYTKPYFVQSRNRLIKEKDNTEFPNEITIMWY